jgi:hypothetical protein
VYTIIEAARKLFAAVVILVVLGLIGWKVASAIEGAVTVVGAVTHVADFAAGGQRAAGATTPPISAADLRTRVYIFADDSMQGRLAGSVGNRKATDYIAAELERLGVQPAGDALTYFQAVRPPSLTGRNNAPPNPRYRNVVAIVPGSDPALRGEYVALGAHNDHVGTTLAPVDHDSTRVAAIRTELARRLGRAPNMAELARAGANLDSLRRLRPPRPDSINNGADDDGSGCMTLLELAEHFITMPLNERPRRSILFVWHTNEEVDLGGSQHFVQNPTVPRNSIVAQINIDMVGRGGVHDTEGGGPNYLAVVGSRRLAPKLGDMVDSVNAAASPQARFDIDYSWDAPDHPEQIYTRSDHYSYASARIPVTFLFTGLHADYHRVTDEPQYIDYAKLEKVARFVAEVVKAVGNAPERPRVTR